MVLALLSGCVSTSVWFPPDMWVEFVDTGFDSGDSGDSGMPTDTGPVDTDPVPDPQGDPGTVDIATASCDPDGQTFLYDVVTFGIVGDATIYVQGNLVPGATETHPMRLINSDPLGGWDWFRVGPLPDQTDVADFVPTENTTFDCDAMADMAFGVVVHDRFGNLSDCRTWGTNNQTLVPVLVAANPGLTMAACTSL